MNYLKTFYSDWIRRWKEQNLFEFVAGAGFALLVLISVIFIPKETFRKYSIYYMAVGE
jgi:hypothetical protein